MNEERPENQPEEATEAPQQEPEAEAAEETEPRAKPKVLKCCFCGRPEHACAIIAWMEMRPEALNLTEEQAAEEGREPVFCQICDQCAGRVVMLALEQFPVIAQQAAQWHDFQQQMQAMRAAENEERRIILPGGSGKPAPQQNRDPLQEAIDEESTESAEE